MARAAEPCSWPPEDGYCSASDGWHVSEKCKDWLHKPASGVFFHAPTQTLWKRADCRGGEGAARYARVAVSSPSGLANVVALGLCGVASSDADKALMRTVFALWRGQRALVEAQFEEMERDLAEDCKEARMAAPPRTSPGWCDDSACSTRRPSLTLTEGSDARASSKASGGLLSRLFACGPEVTAEPPPAEEGPVQLLQLSKASLVRLEMRQEKLPAWPAGATGALGALSRAFGGPPPPDLAEAGRSPEALSHEHRQRASDWRRHAVDNPAVIDEGCAFREGDVVLFDGALGRAMVSRVFPEHDEYVLCNRDGEAVTTKQGWVRYFRADELSRASDLKKSSELRC